LQSKVAVDRAGARTLSADAMMMTKRIRVRGFSLIEVMVVIARHRYRGNWLFFDGHVDWLSYDDASGPDLINWGDNHGTHGGGFRMTYNHAQ
jgi:prepilin-type processing-associated H-X9-DG protein